MKKYSNIAFCLLAASSMIAVSDPGKDPNNRFNHLQVVVKQELATFMAWAKGGQVDPLRRKIYLSLGGAGVVLATGGIIRGIYYCAPTDKEIQNDSSDTSNSSSEGESGAPFEEDPPLGTDQGGSPPNEEKDGSSSDCVIKLEELELITEDDPRLPTISDEEEQEDSQQKTNRMSSSIPSKGPKEKPPKSRSKKSVKKKYQKGKFNIFKWTTNIIPSGIGGKKR